MNNLKSEVSNKSGSHPVILAYVIVIMMMVCFSIVVVNAINSELPDWNGAYLVFMVFIIAVESLLSYRLVKNSTILDSAPVWLRISEWVVILILVKLATYVFTNPAQLLVDLKSWGQNPSSFIFQGSYFFIVIFLAFTWLITAAFAGSLNHLEQDEIMLELERLGNARTDRLDARRKLMGVIFGLGFLMFFLSTISNLKISLPFFNNNPGGKMIGVNIIILLIYFLMGFVLLAQSQFSILRARWFIENIPVSSTIASKWATYSVVTVAVITILVYFMPTSYSLGILDLLRSLLSVLFTVFSFLQIICFAPIAAFLSFLSHLFVTNTLPPSGPTIPTPLPIIPTPSPTSGSWADVIKSIAFWVIFLVLIIIAFRHYFSQRQGLVMAIRNFPIWTWVGRIWYWLKDKIHRANNQVSSMVDKGLARLRSITRANPITIDPLRTISSRLPPRQRIQLIYISMISWNNRNGFPRKGSQTPLEYSRVLSSISPDIQNDVVAITSAFIEARYTRHVLTHLQASEAQETLDRIKSVLHASIVQKQLPRD